MDIEHIKEFIVLSQTQNYYEAAERLYISQPTLTKHISKLEEEIGFSLFVRSYPIRLTNAGRYFLEKISPVVAEIDAAITSAKLVDEGYSGILTIGVPKHTKASYINTIRRFSRKYKEILLKTQLLNPNELFNKLILDEIDVAVGMYSVDIPESKILDQFAKAVYDQGKLCVVVNDDDDRFRKKDKISIVELQNMKYMLVDNTFYRGIYHNFCFLAERYGVLFNHPCMVDNLDEALYNILMQDGFIVTPFVENVYSYGIGYKVLEMEESEFKYKRYFVWKKNNNNPAIIKFINNSKLYVLE